MQVKYAGICLERFKETTVDVIRDSHVLNPLLVEYKEGVIPNVLRCSGQVLLKLVYQEAQNGHIKR
jgi:hypothetical protein